MSSETVYYVVPADGDDFSYPNCFDAMKTRDNEELTLDDIRRSFPLPGSYHFRFKTKWRTSFVWLDVTNPSETVPRYEGKVFVKVARLRGGERKRAQPMLGRGKETAATRGGGPLNVKVKAIVRNGNAAREGKDRRRGGNNLVQRPPAPSINLDADQHAFDMSVEEPAKTRNGRLVRRPSSDRDLLDLDTSSHSPDAPRGTRKRTTSEEDLMDDLFGGGTQETSSTLRSASSGGDADNHDLSSLF